MPILQVGIVRFTPNRVRSISALLQLDLQSRARSLPEDQLYVSSVRLVCITCLNLHCLVLAAAASLFLPQILPGLLCLRPRCCLLTPPRHFWYPHMLPTAIVSFRSITAHTLHNQLVKSHIRALCCRLPFSVRKASTSASQSLA